MREAFEKAGLPWPFPARSLTYEEYCRVSLVVCPHGPDEPCTCTGCGGCSGGVIGCTCDIDWDLMHEVREMWYA